MSNTPRKTIQGFSLKGKSACLIGCGGLGCNISVHLVGAGIDKLYMYDFDSVNESNLNRQFLYTEGDIGKSKCLQAKRRLTDYSSDTSIIAIEKRIEHPDDLNDAADSDIIILAVDNSEARKTVQQFAEKHGKPLVCGGIDGFYGMAYLYLPEKSPCPDCAGLNINSEAKHNISSTAGIVGSAEASLAINYLITGNEKLSGRLMIYDEGTFDTLKIKPLQSCAVCNKNKPTEVII